MENLSPIEDEDELYRRFPLAYLKDDGILSSAASKRGKDPDPEVSVDLARLTDPDECLRRANRPDQGVAALIALVPRGLGLVVRHAPVAGNPAHAVIEGQTTRSQPRLLAAQARIVKKPAGAS